MAENFKGFSFRIKIVGDERDIRINFDGRSFNHSTFMHDSCIHAIIPGCFQILRGFELF